MAGGGKIVDVWGGLRSKSVTLGRTGRFVNPTVGRKSYVHIALPNFHLDLREKEMGEKIAEGLTAILKKKILDGELGRSPSASTLRRRHFRKLQGERAGVIDDRYQRKRDQRRGERNFKRRFQTIRRAMFSPSNAPVDGLFGVESGMLAETLLTAWEAPGVWRVYTANNRGIKDKKGKSALDRVFGEYDLRRLLHSSEGKSLVRGVLKEVYLKNGKLIYRALRQLAGTVGRAGRVGGDLMDMLKAEMDSDDG